MKYQSKMNPSKTLEVSDEFDGDDEIEFEIIDTDAVGGRYIYVHRDDVAALRDHLTDLLADPAPEAEAEAEPVEAPKPEVVKVLLPVEDLPLHYLVQVLDYTRQKITREEIAPLATAQGPRA